MRFKKFFSRVVLSAFGINFCAISLLQAQSAKYIAEKTFPSVVMLLMQDSHAQTITLGSGFFVKDDIVATNLHVIEGSARGYVKIVGKQRKYDIAGFVAIDANMDLVLLKVRDVNSPTLSLGDSNQVSVGDEVYAIGNPQGLEGTFSKGIISGIRKVGEDTIFQITAPISPGSSGGPVLDSKGEVIGVAVATFKGGQNLNFAIPVLYVSNLLSDLKPVKEIALKEKPKQKFESILDGLGGRNTEAVMISHINFEPSSGSSWCLFSIHNKLNCPVSNVRYMFMFYDQDGEPIDYHEGVYPQTGWPLTTTEPERESVIKASSIRPGLAKRVPYSSAFCISDDVVEMMGCSLKDAAEQNRIRVRILDFQIME